MNVDAEGSPPFSAVELAAWRGFLRTHAVVTAHLGAQVEQISNLSLVEAEALLKLTVSEHGRLPMAQLGSETYLTLSASGISRLVDRLHRRGLVLREAAREGDRRAVDVVITERGRRLWEAAAGPHRELVREIFLDPLTDAQLEQLSAMWSRLLPAETD